MSAAWPILKDLHSGDPVPAGVYMLDYRDGETPRWIVHSAETLPSGGRHLVLIDRDNGADTLFGPERPVALTVLTWPHKTLRTGPYLLGSTPRSQLCDLDQQGRNVARSLRVEDSAA